MSDVDRWVTAVAADADCARSEDAVHRLEARLAAEPSPAEASRGREARRGFACVAAAALVGFLTTGFIEFREESRTAPRWLAAPMNTSPSVLLLADGGR